MAERRTKPLGGDHFFARIRTMDLECPKCGVVFCCTGKRGPYSARTARFSCPNCRKIYAVGILLFDVKPDHRRDITPPDWVPTAQQAHQLRGEYQSIARYDELRQRSLATGVAVGEKKGWGDPRNVILPNACECEIVGRGIITHPNCPVHGAARLVERTTDGNIRRL